MGHGKNEEQKLHKFVCHGWKKAVLLLLAALLLEVTVCQFSFWSTCFYRGEDVSDRMEVITRYVAVEDMESAEEYEQTAVYWDERGYMHVPDGALLIRLKDLQQKVDRIHLDISIPEGYLVKASLVVQDEGNAYPYLMGEGRVLLGSVAENAWMKVYPYGKVDNLYLRLETADSQGNAAAGKMGDLVCRVDGMELNGAMPFAFYPVRVLLIFLLLAIFWGLREQSSLTGICFTAEPGNRAGRRKRLAVIVVYVMLLLALAAFFVRINPLCQKNLAPHHAQYQELAVALSQGQVSVKEADPALLEVENPYDTIYLQAKRIPYEADYAYYEGKYYVYFGIVPELLTYLPWYLATGQELSNYAAVFFFFAGFMIASAGLVYELMKRSFPDAPFYLYPVGVGMLVGSYSCFYVLIRPDLYHVPIAASYMFTAAGLWFYLAGLNREKHKAALYAAGSLCLALNAGCRPQFLLFACLAVALFWDEVFKERNLFSKKGAGQTLALALPYAVVAAGIMYYNALRFGSPFDFGAAYSMTSNDMTHRGFNLERILYGFWYFLFQPARMEGNFPYLRSASIETDYLGKMVSESCFGGIFACSMLVWPLFLAGPMKKRLSKRKMAGFSFLSAATALVICAADATGAGILVRYSSDVSFGLFLAAVPALFALAAWAKEKGISHAFLIWLRMAVVLHLAFLGLLLINTDSSVNLLRGNPSLYYSIQAMLRW